MRNKTNFLIGILLAVLLVQSVSASAIATIGMQGLSMVSPESAELINTAICISNPVVCLQGKIIGAVQSEALTALAKESPEIAKAVTTYNQVQGYVDQGAEIVEELQVDETGQVSEGTLQFKDQEGKFGNLIGKDIKQDEIYGKEIEFNKKEGISTISFTGENSYINVKGDSFKDIKTGDKSTPAYINLDEKGVITKADLTASKDTSFVFNDKKLDIKEGMRVFYDNGKINILGKAGDEINLRDKVTNEKGDYSFSNSKNIKILSNDGRLLVEGNKIQGSDFQIEDLRVRGQTFGDVGKIQLTDGGYLLEEKTKVNFNGLEIRSNEPLRSQEGRSKFSEILLVTDKNKVDTSLYRSYVIPEEKLIAGGDNFQLELNEGNPWINIDSEKNQELVFSFKTKDLNSASGVSIENRYENNLPPLVEIFGDESNIEAQNGESMFGYNGRTFLYDPNYGDSNIPIEFVEPSKKNGESWLFDNGGGWHNNYYESPSYSGENYKLKVYMDDKGDVKYPIIKVANDPNFIRSDNFNPGKYYLDDRTLGLAKTGAPFTSALLHAFPENNQLKQTLLDNLEYKDIRINFESTDFGADYGDLDYLLTGLEDYKSDPEIQKEFLKRTNFKEIGYDSEDTIVFPSILKEISNKENLDLFLEKYDFVGGMGNKRGNIENEGWSNAYDYYNNFDRYFPEYSNYDLTDSQKMSFVVAGIKNQYNFNDGEDIDYIKQGLNSYFYNKEKDPILLDKTNPLYLYTSNTDQIFKTEGESLSKNFEQVISRDVNEFGFSLDEKIKQDISDPDISDAVFVFANHGLPDMQEVGTKAGGIFSIDLTDSEMADSLFKRYVSSSNNPEERTFGNTKIVLASCYSGDYINNVQNILKKELQNKLNLNPNDIQLPVMISASEPGSISSMGGGAGILAEISRRMGDGSFDYEDFLDTKSRSQGVTNPTLWVNEYNNIDNQKVCGQNYCRML